MIRPHYPFFLNFLSRESLNLESRLPHRCGRPTVNRKPHKRIRIHFFLIALAHEIPAPAMNTSVEDLVVHHVRRRQTWHTHTPPAPVSHERLTAHVINTNCNIKMEFRMVSSLTKHKKKKMKEAEERGGEE